VESATKALTLCVLTVAASLSAAAPAAAGRTSSSSFAGQFQMAVSLYQSRQFSRAHEVLESLLLQLPDDFEINELMGLVCEAQHDQGEAEGAFKKAAELAPQSFAANHNLGEFYIQEGKIAAAIPYLQKAQERRASYNNGYDLALAEIETRRYAEAKQEIRQLVGVHNTAELHSLLAAADEKSGQYVHAANEYELAAHMDPSEKNISAWGSDLLVHQALEPATRVFERGVQLYPNSAGLRIGLGMAFYSARRYQDAFQALCGAIDLNPRDSRPYLILGKIYDVSPAASKKVTATFARFAHLEPNNPKALYYYALSLWEAPSTGARALVLQKVETLLETAIKLDPALGEAHLQLGILCADKGDYAKGIAEYHSAIRLEPTRADAHYRLARALLRIGDKAMAQKEFETFDRLHALDNAEWEKQRRSIITFAYQTDSRPSAGH
jgi:Flp pilus assembly protein TadD